MWPQGGTIAEGNMYIYLSCWLETDLVLHEKYTGSFSLAFCCYVEKHDTLELLLWCWFLVEVCFLVGQTNVEVLFAHTEKYILTLRISILWRLGDGFIWIIHALVLVQVWGELCFVSCLCVSVCIYLWPCLSFVSWKNHSLNH